ncbi:MAG TPA: magnesium transporter CorA family protein [Candidatus Sumerlaeota bacterium]|nr:magnesium transporter CorA family protein [Candidatus Sumerlaeota bacterium]
MQLTLYNASGEPQDIPTLKEFEERDLELRSRGEWFWVDVEGATSLEMVEFARHFDIHRMTADDCLNRLAPVKIEMAEDYLFLVTHVLNFNEGWDKLETLNLSFILFKECCITVHSQPVRSVAIAARQMKGENCQSLNGSFKVLYLTLQAIMGFYAELVEDVCEDVDTLEDSVMEGQIESSLLQNVASSARHLAVVRRRLVPTRRVLERLCEEGEAFLDPEARIYLRDALDGVIRLIEKGTVIRDALNTAQSNHLAHLSNQANAVMRTLSVVATIMMPLTFVTSLFGMNVKVPGQEVDGLFYFNCIVGGMLVLTLLMILIFRRRGWF